MLHQGTLHREKALTQEKRHFDRKQSSENSQRIKALSKVKLAATKSILFHICSGWIYDSFLQGGYEKDPMELKEQTGRPCVCSSYSANNAGNKKRVKVTEQEGSCAWCGSWKAVGSWQ